MELPPDADPLHRHGRFEYDTVVTLAAPGGLIPLPGNGSVRFVIAGCNYA